MKSLIARLRGLTRPAGPPTPLRIRRATYTIEIRDTARAYLTLETRWQSLVDRLTSYDQTIPVGAGRVDRLQASLGAARLVSPEEAGRTQATTQANRQAGSQMTSQANQASDQALYQIDLPAPVHAHQETTQVLSAILIDAFPASSSALAIRPLYPIEAIGLAIVFPLTRPPRQISLLRTDVAIPEPDPTALQATPRADGRLAYLWLKESPPSGAAYCLTWQW